MFNFTAFKWRNYLYATMDHQQYKFDSGEILTGYLNCDSCKLEALYHELWQLDLWMVNDDVLVINDRIHRVQQFMNYFDYYAGRKHKPFFVSMKKAEQPLYDLLSAYHFLFKEFDSVDLPDLLDTSEESNWEENHLYQTLEPSMDSELPQTQLTDFQLNSKRIKKRRLYPYLDELNRRVQRLVGRYLEHPEDVLRAKYVFADFLDNYFHTGDSMPTPHQAAAA